VVAVAAIDFARHPGGDSGTVSTGAD
jgi:hypothetical protein